MEAARWRGTKDASQHAHFSGACKFPSSSSSAEVVSSRALWTRCCLLVSHVATNVARNKQVQIPKATVLWHASSCITNVIVKSPIEARNVICAQTCSSRRAMHDIVVARAALGPGRRDHWRRASQHFPATIIAHYFVLNAPMPVCL